MENTGLWVAPLLLMPGVCLLILSTSMRWGQLHQELVRQQSEGHEDAISHLCQRARLLHRTLVSLYVSIAVLSLSSLLGTLVSRWFASMQWLPESLAFVGIVLITYASVQLIRESRLLITVLVDNPAINVTTGKG